MKHANASIATVSLVTLGAILVACDESTSGADRVATLLPSGGSDSETPEEGGRSTTGGAPAVSRGGAPAATGGTPDTGSGGSAEPPAECLGVPWPIDATGWVDRAATGCGIQGAWYWFSDGVGTTLSGVTANLPPYREAQGMCLAGQTIVDASFDAWGAGIALNLNQESGSAATPYDLTSQGIDAFDVTVSGSAVQELRFALPSNLESELAAPFVTLPGAGTHRVRVADAVVPETWPDANAGERVDPTRVVAVQLLVVGGVAAGAFDVCVESLTPIAAGGQGTGGGSGSGGATASGGSVGATGGASTCSGAAEACEFQEDCCMDFLCVSFDEQAPLCAGSCSQNAGCLSGCCAILDNFAGSCGPVDLCGGTGCRGNGWTCDSAADCCVTTNGSAAPCVDPGLGGPKLCSAPCTMGAECESGCCFRDGNGVQACLSAEFCQ